jgi:membrane protein DedA with SNARE-associated domain
VTIEALLTLAIGYGLWVVFVAIVLDNVGLPVPGELVLLGYGLLARQGELHPAAVAAVGALAAMTGDTLAYWLGRLWGERLLALYCRASLGSERCAEKTARYYARYGVPMVAAGRFIVGARLLLNPLAGSVRLPFARFLAADAIGAMVWAWGFVLLGYFAAGQLRTVRDAHALATILLAGALGTGVLGYLIRRLASRMGREAVSVRVGAPPLPAAGPSDR